MELYWREHRGFILTVGGALLVGILHYWWVIAPKFDDAHKLRTQSDILRMTLAGKKADGVLRESDLTAARRDLQVQEEILHRLKEDVKLQLPSNYRMPSSVRNPKVFFQDLLLAERKRLGEMSLKTAQGVKLPKNVGFPDSIEDKAVPEYLARLSLAVRIASSAILAGCDAIDSIDATAEEKEAAGGRYGKVLLVRAKVAGSPESVLKTLHALQKKGDFLVLVSFDLHKPDPAIDRATADLVVGGILEIDEPEPAPGEATPEQAPKNEQGEWPFGK